MDSVATSEETNVNESQSLGFYDMDTASPFKRTDIISMILEYKAAQTFHLKPFIRWTPTLFQTTIKTSLKGATPKSVLELTNVKYLTLAHVKSHLQLSRNYFLDV